MNLYVFLLLIEDNKLEEILPTLETAKSQTKGYGQSGNDYFAEMSIGSAIAGLRSDHSGDQTYVINRVGYIIKWLSLHSAIN